MAAGGQDETPGERPPVREPETGPEDFDLWSLPPRTLNLDDPALWGDDALDRLAEVLPILAQDADATPGLGPSPRIDQATGRELTRGPDPAAGRDLPVAADPVAADPVAADPVGADPVGVREGRPARRQESGPSALPAPGSRRRRARATPQPAKTGSGRARGLSVAGIVVLLAAVYVASVALAMLGRSNLVKGGPTGQRRVRIVTDGPLPCPMYRVPEQGRAPSAPAGSCFFVG